MKHLIAVLAAVLVSGLPATAGSNAGLMRRDVVAVRVIYRSVEHGITTGRLKKEERTVDGCSPWSEYRTIFTGKAGVIRKYVWHGGTDDSLFTIRHYYDNAGRLRFVFISAGSVNNTRMEQRIYFNERGARIRETREFTEGPGYPFPYFTDEEGLLQRDARRAWERLCSRNE